MAPRWVGRWLRCCVSSLLVVGVLSACTANWRAPVETRGSQPAGKAESRAVRPPAPRLAIRGSDYRVQRGDTLHGIAWQTGIDHRLIAKWNGLRPPYRIYAGQTLRLKAPPAHRSPPPARQPTAKRKPPAAPAPKAASKPATNNRRLQWTWPVQGRVVAGFKPSDPLHSGIKIAAAKGTRIRSAESGEVVYSGSGLIGYGRLIILKHNDKYWSAYGHNRKILVAEGDRVTKGQTIAEMGTADSGAALLHFEIRRDGKAVDPIRLLPRR